MDKRTVIVEGANVLTVMIGIGNFLKKVSDGLVGESYVGEVFVEGKVDGCDGKLNFVFDSKDVRRAQTIMKMIQTLKENRGGSVALLVEGLNICDKVSDVELCLVYEE